MAKDFDEPMQWTKKGIQTIVQSEIHKWENRMQKSEDAHMRCTGGHGDAESDQFDDIMDALGTMAGAAIAHYPLSIIWVIGSILLGIGTGSILESLGWGLLALVGGWVVYRLALFVK